MAMNPVAINTVNSRHRLQGPNIHRDNQYQMATELQEYIYS